MSEPFIYRPPQDPYLNILYRDDHLIVLDKPPGLLSVPGRAAAHKDSLASRVLRVLPAARVVHRLDMATSGLIVMAIGLEAQRALSRQFAQRQTRKTYHAQVLGEPYADSGVIDLPLRCDWLNRPRQMVDLVQGKPAQTHWKVASRQDGHALLELKPITGRSHQLRVHMQALGHPILGDALYAPAAGRRFARQLQLHASELTLQHPASGESMVFSSPHQLMEHQRVA